MYDNYALKIVKPGKLQLKECELTGLREGELIVRLHYASVCYADVKAFCGLDRQNIKYPCSIGSRWVGVVDQAGSHTTIPVGARVILNPHTKEFLSAKGNRIVSYQNNSEEISNYIIVREEMVTCCPDVKEKWLYTFATPLTNAIYNLEQTIRIHRGQPKRVLINGIGENSMMLLFALQQMNIDEIVVTDTLPFRIKIGKNLGFSNVTFKNVYTDELTVETVGSFDLCIDADGKPGSLQKMCELVKPGSQILCIPNEFVSTNVILNLKILQKNECSIHCWSQLCSEPEKAFEIIHNYREQMDSLITNKIPFSQSPILFEKVITDPKEFKIILNMLK